MYYYLEGNVSIIAQNLAVIDIGGVGYACKITLNTMSRLELNHKTRLYTYCHIKEDIFDIYGFYDLSEKRCFEHLLTVSGVGPKAALSILSACTPESLALAIINNDEAMLTVAQGIGKKVASRIILELKDKVAKEASSLKMTEFVRSHDITGGGALDVSGTGQRDASATLAVQALAVQGLQVLGYSQAEISAAMRPLDISTMSVEEIIREVLKNSMKN